MTQRRFSAAQVRAMVDAALATQEETIAALRAENEKLKQDETCEEYYRDLRNRERDLIAENEALKKAEDLAVAQWEAKSVSPSDPFVILAGIKQFGLAPDGADLRDLEAAIRQAHAEGYAAAREDAARVAEGRTAYEPGDTSSGPERYWRGAIAAAIRALPDRGKDA